jgi:hypothetical protein
VTVETDGLVGRIDVGPCDAGDWRKCAVAGKADGFSAQSYVPYETRNFGACSSI